MDIDQRYKDPGLPIDARVEILLSQMTLEEKVAQLGSLMPNKILDTDGKFDPNKAETFLANGIGQISRIAGFSGLSPIEAAQAANEVQEFMVTKTRLGIPAIIHEECLSGYMGKGGTTYPQSIGVAATFDPALLERETTEIRKQLRAIGAHLALSPVLDVARDLRWGRVEETFGEDPYLVAAMAVAYVRGLQGDDLRHGIIATLKHFAGHGMSEGGRNHAPVNVSPREFREMFLFPYEAAIRLANAGSVMNAYHDIDGYPCGASYELLTEILRGELGFDGIVISDYFSIKYLRTDHHLVDNDQDAAIAALEAGLDVELPETDCYKWLVSACTEGRISVEAINQAVRRVLTCKFKLGLFEQCFVEVEKVLEVFETPEQRKLALDVARKSIVLLKNENNILPLAKENFRSIAVIGPNAAATRNLLGDYAYTAHVNSKEDGIKIVSILEGLSSKLEPEIKVTYAQGCDIMDDSTEGFAEAVEIAKESDVAIVVVGGKSGLSGMGSGKVLEPDGESHDRTDITLTGAQEQLLKAVYETGTPTILVLVNGRPLSIPWAKENIPAIVEAWLPGEEGGNAVAEVLLGEYNPGGRLPVSIPKKIGQTPIYYNRKPISYNRDYVFEDGQALYPFGYGLSYTAFEYSNLEIAPSTVNSASYVEISFDLKNTGEVTGDEVVQLYVRDQVASRTRPIKELKGFLRICLKPQEQKRITFKLAVEQLAFYNREMRSVVEPGKFTAMIGASSEDIRLEGEFEVRGEEKLLGYSRTYFSEVEVN
ncbi:MAG: beta-glucosidase [Firmicutes bacterium]|nr:beta-glucosidase [Bacillota bacterium]